MAVPRILARFDRHGVDLWAAREPGASFESQHHCELTDESYLCLFSKLKKSGGRAGLTDLGAGCGLGVALAVSAGGFRRAVGVEAVAVRSAAANEALRDLNLHRRASVAHGSFFDDGFRVETPCALSMDVVFDRPTLKALALALESSPLCLAFVSFRPLARWRAAGLASYSPAGSGRVSTSGGERFTYTLYKRTVL